MKGPPARIDSKDSSSPRSNKSLKTPNSAPILIPTSYDEAKASCKARKRKERQESISSLCQERKVIRSNSEERPSGAQRKSSVIRRVSSSEDFQKNRKSTTERGSGNSSPALQATADVVLIYEEREYERRRSHERFSKPLTFANRNTSGAKTQHRSRRPKVKCLKTKFKPEVAPANTIENINVITTATEEVKLDQQVPAEADSQANTRPSSPNNLDLDLTTLHEQVDSDEPVLSCGVNFQIDEDTETMPGLSVATNRLLSSPRNSIIATHRIYLDPDIQQKSISQNPLEVRLQKLTKQINTMKKKIKKYEAEFEKSYGYKLSHADKLNDKNIKKLYLDLNKIKKEHKQLMEVCPSGVVSVDESASTNRDLQGTLNEIEKRLSQKRDVCNRPRVLEKMSTDELLDEKVAVQKALLFLESIHGRPANKEDRNLARPIYDRYRNLKRMLGKNTSSASGNELATIHEDETMNFITALSPPQTSIVTEIDSERSSTIASTDDSSDTEGSISDNLHSLSFAELIEQLRSVVEEKKELRRIIKGFEVEFQRKFGRIVLQREDKLPIEHVYTSYKKVRAKLKLLEALVGKQQL